MALELKIDISAEVERLASEQRKARDKADEMVAKITAEDRDFTKEEQAKYDELVGEVMSLGKRSDRLKKMTEERGAAGDGERSRTQPKKIAGQDDEDAQQKATSAARSAAFGLWLRHGFSALNAEQRDIMGKYSSQVLPDGIENRAMSAILGSGGGFVCPPEFNSQIEVAMKDYSGVEQMGATVINSSTGNDLPWPTNNDTGNEGEQVEESQTQTELNATFGLVNLKSYTFSSKLVLIPVQLLQDSSVAIEPFVSKMLGERLGRITNKRFTTGTGANQPQGVVTGSTLGKQVASASAITFEELLDLEHSIDPAYRNGAAWMFNDSTLMVLRKLKDSDGRPIWQPSATSGLAAGVPSTLHGYKYVSNNSMAAIGTGNKSIVFGAMRKYFIRKTGGITLVRLAERYAEKLQVGLFAFLRADGRIVDAGTNPIKHILHP